MNGTQDAQRVVEALLIEEGRLLDRRDWSAWLALYHAEVIYRVPAWRDEDTETEDPECEISLIYHVGRKGLEERVTRVRSRQTVTAMPLPRTTHLVANVEVLEGSSARIAAIANWQVLIYQPRNAGQSIHHGWCEVEVIPVPGTSAWCFRRKIIHLVNDCVNAVLDFYLL